MAGDGGRVPDVSEQRAEVEAAAFVYPPAFYTGPNQYPQSDALMHCEFCRLCRACGKRLRWSFLRGGLWVGHTFACERRGERTGRAR